MLECLSYMLSTAFACLKIGVTLLVGGRKKNATHRQKRMQVRKCFIKLILQMSDTYAGHTQSILTKKNSTAESTQECGIRSHRNRGRIHLGI